ncbi:hypothetical protein [Curtobacterium sp. VKM Ac-1376]|uniref:hypothetical protein n=1 Tax=Curtobacterium sp. VKM Ac-1376 TaxID=123312 RepID=UPI00188C3A49|nr:hypothetical protein [Curtobacterium sp. VKM Ac-1376]MBF4613281.1 hypothetical protein [Curtobacterium sp. VKM Ac-1376]
MQYGTVTGRLLAAVADSVVDADFNPDEVPLSGRVVFTPSATALKVVAAGATILPVPIKCDLDSEGYLTLNGKRGVNLIATDTTETNPTGFTYRVSFESLTYAGTPVSYGSFSIAVPAGQTIDLAVVAPVATANGAAIIRGEPGAVTDVTIGEVQTVDATADADAFLTGDETVKQLNLVLPRGPKGDQGADGSTALPAVPTSPGSRAQLITYGHSFLAEQGLTDESQYWARRLAKSLGLTYPTSDGGPANDLKRASGGTTIGDSLGRVAGGIGTAPWVPGTKALVVLQALINSARQNGATAIDITSAINSARGIMALVNASEIVQDTDARIVKSATTWQVGTGFFAGGTAQYSSTVGSYFEYVVPADRDVFIATVCRGAGTAGAVVNITDQTAGTTLVTGLDLSASSIANASIYVWRTPASARGHTVRFTKTGGTSLYIDAVLPVSPNPPPVLWMKEPYLANYAASTQFPNGSDAALDAFNAIVDQMSAEFPNLIVADPNQAGYWDKANDVLSDQVHPNEQGHYHLARAAHDAVRAWQARKALALI